ncbi:hypothetical protein H920_14699 [Fukomys damarensis]|uniref:Uncharacterized protein n=1 Tax=Fukomys damarensis TaxID=885580 RepID=A0A091DM62_FUKDA|nr:hypothetical protein H920_14699 [Fukomys damarensis]
MGSLLPQQKSEHGIQEIAHRSPHTSLYKARSPHLGYTRFNFGWCVSKKPDSDQRRSPPSLAESPLSSSVRSPGGGAPSGSHAWPGVGLGLPVFAEESSRGWRFMRYKPVRTAAAEELHAELIGALNALQILSCRRSALRRRCRNGTIRPTTALHAPQGTCTAEVHELQNDLHLGGATKWELLQG